MTLSIVSFKGESKDSHERFNREIRRKERMFLKKKPVVLTKEKLLYESLILAQDERWRRA